MSLTKIDWNPGPGTLRTFGFIGAVGFPLLAILAWRRLALFGLLPAGAAAPTAVVLLVAGFTCLALAFVAPALLRPLYVVMAAIGYPIGLVVGAVALGIIYYLVITPIGLIFRLIGRDAMSRKWDPAAASYWSPRTQATDVRRYFRQF